MGLELSAVDRMARQDLVAEAGRESLDLPLDPFGHVFHRSVRHVAISPRRVLTGRGARRIEKRLLRDEHERPLGVAAAPDFRLVQGDLLDRAADVDRRCSGTFCGAPRNRSIERPVDLEHTGTVSESLQAANVARWKRVARNGRQLPRRDIEDRCAARWKVSHRSDRRRSSNFTAQRSQAFRESVYDHL